MLDDDGMRENIPKTDLQTARRYGMEEDGRGGGRRRQRKKYTFGGIVFIYDTVQNC